MNVSRLLQGVFCNNPLYVRLKILEGLGSSMSDDDRMSRSKKIRASAIACSVSMLIAVIANGTLADKLLWFVEISGFCLFAIWTIW